LLEGVISKTGTNLRAEIAKIDACTKNVGLEALILQSDWSDGLFKSLFQIESCVCMYPAVWSKVKVIMMSAKLIRNLWFLLIATAKLPDNDASR
jgi:hypothetical protein